MTDLDNTEDIQKIIKASQEVKQRAYCPYSKFKVGAALLCEDGTIITGCNVENASYGLSLCAERNVMTKAVSEGHQRFRAIAVSSDLKKSYIVPCGACRQTMVEFGADWNVYMTKPDATYKVMKTGQLLPLHFELDNENE